MTLGVPPENIRMPPSVMISPVLIHPHPKASPKVKENIIIKKTSFI